MEKISFTEDYKKADKLGLTELNRWEDGIDHHPTSERLVRFMADHDLNDYNDSMCIKVGGDGDNGEQLMYLMDPFFEMLDKQKQFLCFWVGEFIILLKKGWKKKKKKKNLSNKLCLMHRPKHLHTTYSCNNCCVRL